MKFLRRVGIIWQLDEEVTVINSRCNRQQGMEKRIKERLDHWHFLREAK